MKDQTQPQNQNKTSQANQLNPTRIAIINPTLNRAAFSKAKINFLMLKLQKQQLEITARNFQKQNWKQKFQMVIEAYTLELSIYSNKHSEIIKQIAHVSFPKLKALWLFQNNITNIEAISWMNFPTLFLISLGNNKICKINCLKKLSLPELQNLTLINNPIKCMQSLSKAKFASEAMMYLPFEHLQTDNTLCQNINQIVKMSPKKIQNIYIHNQTDRIQQQKVIKMLEKRNYGPFKL